MSTRRRPVDTVSILLNQVTEVIENATPQSNDNPLFLSFQKIKTQLEDMKDRLFPQFDHCDKALMNALAALEKLIDDDDDMFVHRDQDEKIKSIEENLEYIDKLKSQINLPEPAESAGELQSEDPSVAEARKASGDWLRLSVEENILSSPAMASLQLSYDALDLQLKLCLLCLAVFPEMVVVKKKPLIFWWIGEGLVRKSRDKSAEEVGEGIFNKLVGKGMIEPFHKGEDQKSPVVDSCVIHPWIRRMLIAVARKAEFLDIDRSGKIVNYSKSGRACLVSGNQGFSDINSPNEEELFSVFNVNEQYLSFKPELFLKLRKLVVMQLGRWQNWAEHHIEVENCDFIYELHAQKHLRYLSLQGISGITSIPSSIVECNDLEILDLRACHNLETLPSDIGRLRKLTHLDVSQCYLLESMPKGIEKLSSLQVLKGFVIGHAMKNPCKLGDLAQLKKLRKLSIHIGSEAVIQEGELNKLKEIVSLRVLTIAWRGVVLQSKYGMQMGSTTISNAGQSYLWGKDVPNKLNKTATLTMMSFSFPPKLEKLDLRCFPGRTSPDWLKPSNMEHLKRLYIRGGELDCLVSEENKKWGVKILRVKYLKNLKMEESLLQKDFPDLVYFERVKCHQYQHGELEQYEPDVEWNSADGWEVLTHKLRFNGRPVDMTEIVVVPSDY